MKLLESGEMYLETILILQHKNGAVRSLDIAEYMGFSQPSVSRAMGILRGGGYILTDADGFITLTASGRERAEKIYERHTVLTDMLISIGVSPETAADDACKIEHDLSDETFNAIKKHVREK